MQDILIECAEERFYMYHQCKWKYMGNYDTLVNLKILSPTLS